MRFNYQLVKNYFGFIFIILISLIPILDLFHPGLPVTHDGQDHVARIANFYQSLSEGNLIPRWGANLNWGYGHPVLMFLYPLQSYLASFFHAIGFSFIDSVKVVFGLAFILSGITMYIWIRSFLGEIAGITAGVLYLFAPYRFIDLYVRGALGEHVAFIFPPLILYFLLKLSVKNPLSQSSKYIIGSSAATALLILSHNAISLMFLPFIILYILYLYFYISNNKNFLLSSIVSIFLGFALSSFFWVPAFFEGKYTLRNIVTAGEYVNRFIDPSGLLWGVWNYGITGQFSIQIGIVHWIGIILIPIVAYFLLKKDKKLLPIFLITIVYLLISIFLMMKESNFIWQKVIILQNFQFPWRLLSVVVFATAVIAGFLAHSLNKKIQLLFLGIFLLLIFYFNNNFWHAKSFLYKQDSFFSSVYLSTTDTGESSPIWSVRFMEKIPKEKIETIEGSASIKEVVRKSNNHFYKIDALVDSRIKENTLFFPGWKIFVDNKEVPIQFQDARYRGLMTFEIDKGSHDVNVVFQETKLRIIADTIFVAGILSIIVFSFIIINNDRKS